MSAPEVSTPELSDIGLYGLAVSGGRVGSTSEAPAILSTMYTECPKVGTYSERLGERVVAFRGAHCY